MKTSEKSDRIISLPLISSAEDFPVSRTASQEIGKRQETNETCGERCSVLFAKLSQDGCWQRTYQDCSPLKLDGSLDEFSGTWPASGTMSNGKAYQRRRLVPLTVGTGSSSWPAATVNDSRNGANRTAQRSNPNSQHHDGVTLVDAVRMWPTPSSQESQPTEDFLAEIKNESRGGPGHRLYLPGRKHHTQQTLSRAVHYWPTPTARDRNTLAKCKRGANASPGGTPLPIAVGGTLNPPWVEWLMGFPLGWTDLGA